MSESGPRYAIYFAPDPASELWRFGSACLAYDAAVGRDCDPLRVAVWSPEDWLRITEEPRKYGFHATLKPPFHLREGVRESALHDVLDSFVHRQQPFVIEGLGVTALARFVALAPAGDSSQLAALAKECVRAFDDLRAPPSTADIERRRPLSLTQRQQEHLARWGYPYVMDDFRFHMTLTGALPPEQREATARELSRLHAELVGTSPVAIDAIALFRQDHRAARFELIRRAPLRAPRSVEAPK